MRFSVMTILAAVLTLMAVDVSHAAPWINPARVRYDNSVNPISRAIQVTFTSASIETVDVGIIADVVAVGSGTANVSIEPLGDPGCVIGDGDYSMTRAGRTIANPSAGLPCIDWVPITVPAGQAMNIGFGGIRYIVVGGVGSAGTIILFCSKFGG